jgi:hypothetical protein
MTPYIYNNFIGTTKSKMQSVMTPTQLKLKNELRTTKKVLMNLKWKYSNRKNLLDARTRFKKNNLIELIKDKRLDYFRNLSKTAEMFFFNLNLEMQEGNVRAKNGQKKSVFI